MYRWEFGTAIAGAVLGVNPFDQPNVQLAKDNTAAVLAAYERDGALPASPVTLSVDELLAQARPGDYFAVMAYVHQTPRGRRRHRIPAAPRHGAPRHRHDVWATARASSTPPGSSTRAAPPRASSCRSLWSIRMTIDVPGQSYSFGTLAGAQALGDLQALQAAGLRVARVHLTGDAAEGIAAL